MQRPAVLFPVPERTLAARRLGTVAVEIGETRIVKLVATHPDGNGGLSFLAEYPNAYALFMFAISAVVAVALARNVFEGGISSAMFGILTAVWLGVVLGIFAIPLLAFTEPLSELKEKSLFLFGAQATRRHRQTERALIGRNVAADEPSEFDQTHEEADFVSAIRADAKALDFSAEPRGRVACRRCGFDPVRYSRRRVSTVQRRNVGLKETSASLIWRVRVKGLHGPSLSLVAESEGARWFRRSSASPTGANPG